MERDRGYVTIADVAYYFAALAILGALAPAFMSVLNARAGDLSRGQELILLGIIPLMLLVMLVLYFRKSSGGAN